MRGGAAASASRDAALGQSPADGRFRLGTGNEGNGAVTRRGPDADVPQRIEMHLHGVAPVTREHGIGALEGVAPHAPGETASALAGRGHGAARAQRARERGTVPVIGQMDDQVVAARPQRPMQRAVAGKPGQRPQRAPVASDRMDAGDGRLFLGRNWLLPWQRELKLEWDLGGSEGVIDTIVGMHRRLSEVAGGKLMVPVYWRLFRNLVTVHPLGGCRMGLGPESGVVDHRGEVFGYPRLYVADGSIVPRALGLNPSKTIAAVAEQIAERMLDSHG